MKRKSGFSLIELLVVIGIMALLAALVIPGLFTMMSSSSDDQTYEMFAAQMNLARAIALTENTYTLVHCQPAQDAYVKLHPELEDTTYMTILILDKDKGTDTDGDGIKDGLFVLPRLHTKKAIKDKYSTLELVALPKGWAIMAVDNMTVKNTAYDRTYLADVVLRHAMTATVIFNPAGQVVSQFPGGTVPIDYKTSQLFGSATSGKMWYWSASGLYGKRPGATAVTIVNYGEIKYLQTSSGVGDVNARRDWLNKNAQFLSINVYTGQLFPRTVPAPPTP